MEKNPSPPETPINTGDSKGMMKGEGFCAYPISKKRFDEFLEREHI